jgi:hypothetical protein
MKKINLHTGKKQERSRLHKEMLGMDIPENYFSNSKSRIMDKVAASEKHTSGIFIMRPAFRYAMAAAIIILIGLGIALNYLSDHEDNNSIQGPAGIEYANLQDTDMFVDFILVKDKEVEMFLDHYLLEGVLVKAELKEQEFDNLFMNSLIVKDSLIDTYIDDQFIDNIIL